MVEARNGISELSRSLIAHRDAVYGYVLGIVRDTAAADDVTQETLVRALRRLSTLENRERLLPWLYRIATNLCHDYYRHSSYRHRPLSLDTEAPGEDEVAASAIDTAPRLDTVLEQEDMSTCVQEYLADLPDTYRAVILLHDAEGLTNPEIAAMLGVSLATVKIRLHRARRKLREVLARACSFSTDERGVLVCDPTTPEP